MPEMNYSMKVSNDAEKKLARAQVHDIDASYKDMCEVVRSIKGLPVEEAELLLIKAAAGDMPIWFRKHNKKMGHRSEIGGKKGRYPMKCSKLALGVLKNAIANANSKGLFGQLVVVQAAANKQLIYPRMAPKGGKPRRSYYVTCWVEIVLKEKKAASEEQKKAKKTVIDAKISEKRAARKEAEKLAEKEMKEMEAAGEEVGKPQTAEEKAAEKALENAAAAQV